MICMICSHYSSWSRFFRAGRSLICMVCMTYQVQYILIAPVAGWESSSVHGLTHASWLHGLPMLPGLDLLRTRYTINVPTLYNLSQRQVTNYRRSWSVRGWKRFFFFKLFRRRYRGIQVWVLYRNVPLIHLSISQYSGLETDKKQILVSNENDAFSWPVARSGANRILQIVSY